MIDDACVRLRPSEPPFVPVSWPKLVQVAAACTDILSITASGLVAGHLCAPRPNLATAPNAYLGATLLVATLFVALVQASGLYHPRELLKLDRQLRWVMPVNLGAVAFMIWIAFLISARSELTFGFGALFAGLGCGVLAGQRVLWRYGLSRTVASRASLKREVIAFVSGSWPLDPMDRAAMRSRGLNVVDTLPFPARASVSDVKEAAARLASRVRGSTIQEIVVVLPPAEYHLIEPILGAMQVVPLPVRLLLDRTLSRFALQQAHQFDDFALVEAKREPLNEMELASKRALDLVVASMALVALAPLLAMAALAVKLDSPGPALFRQTRRGFNGRTFQILKLRTMTVMEDGPEVTQAKRDDSRVTRVGYWLRRSSIDELPQLWNVLKGEMSIVGPRPHAVAHDNHYDGLIANYSFRQHVKPGLTGLAQINGHRGETPEVASMVARVDYDIRYVSNWSLMLDIRIILMTGTRLFAGTAY